MFPFVDQAQNQTGWYLQDQVKWNDLVVTLSGREDSVHADNFGTITDDDEFTYRVGANYVFDNGFAPYVQYATSFQPTYGATFTGVPFVPTTGDQFEGGIKWDGPTSPKATSSSRRSRPTRSSRTTCSCRTRTRHTRSTDPGRQRGRQGHRGRVRRPLQERLSLNASYTYTDTDPRLFMVAKTNLRARRLHFPGRRAAGLWRRAPASATSTTATAISSTTNR
jgi:iron complex outermembrane receptor protein